MHSWEGKAYWARADDISYEIYHQLIQQFEKRGTSITSFTFSNNLTFDFKTFDDQICIDIIHNISSSKEIKEPDNFAACYAEGDFSEIEIKTVIPRYSRVNSIRNNKKFQWDFINVIRHEVEHVVQGCDLQIETPKLVEYSRSDNNFLLESCEVPAYVHGFRIATKSRSHFKDTIENFISKHGRHLKLDETEVELTVKIWMNYLKSLKYYSKI